MYIAPAGSSSQWNDGQVYHGPLTLHRGSMPDEARQAMWARQQGQRTIPLPDVMRVSWPPGLNAEHNRESARTRQQDGKDARVRREPSITTMETTWHGRISRTERMLRRIQMVRTAGITGLEPVQELGTVTHGTPVAGGNAGGAAGAAGHTWNGGGQGANAGSGSHNWGGGAGGSGASAGSGNSLGHTGGGGGAGNGGGNGGGHSSNSGNGSK